MGHSSRSLHFILQQLSDEFLESSQLFFFCVGGVLRPTTDSSPLLLYFLSSCCLGLFVPTALSRCWPMQSSSGQSVCSFLHNPSQQSTDRNRNAVKWIFITGSRMKLYDSQLSDMTIQLETIRLYDFQISLYNSGTVQKSVKRNFLVPNLNSQRYQRFPVPSSIWKEHRTARP